ncbi:hypothetical protein RRG44_00080 [Mycoplasmopsis cynos]|uniref:hypothetical protein n=2 Tax=Mycoplasmopsis cynos TaxID=171284 RepID=UPI002AFE865C|nr:hypothetical protein [Mycoplasmopsis cynos]WQQ19227.1 hypothetical protein RRG44_00080 [Mycoplasmopsis cynos]
MTLKKIYNKLDIKYLENNEKISPNRKLSRNTKVINTCLLSVLLFMIVCSIAYLIPNVSKSFRIFYIFSFGLTFGGSVWAFIPLCTILLLFRVINHKLESKIIFWLSRRKKMNWWDYKRKIILISVWTFILVLLCYHIGLHFNDPKLREFDFNTEKLRNLFYFGWWDKFYNVGIKDTNQNVTIIDNLIKNYSLFSNLGFLFDTLLNVLYFISISFIFPIVLIIILIVWIVKEILFPYLFVKYQGKWKKTINNTILNEKNYLENVQKYFINTLSTQIFYNFLVFIEKTQNTFRIKQFTFFKFKTTILKHIKDEKLLNLINEFMSSKLNESINQYQNENKENVNQIKETKNNIDLYEEIYDDVNLFEDDINITSLTNINYLNESNNESTKNEIEDNDIELTIDQIELKSENKNNNVKIKNKVDSWLDKMSPIE